MKMQPDLKPAAKKKLDAAMRMLFSTKQYGEVGMREIARTAGISIDTIYRHYGSKEKLLFAFFDEWISGIRARIIDHLKGLSDPVEKLRKASWLLHEFIEKNPDVGRIYFIMIPHLIADPTYYPASILKIYGLYLKVIKEGQAKNVISPDIPSDLILEHLVGIVRTAFIYREYHEIKAPFTKLAALDFDLFLKGVGNVSK